MKRLFIGVVIYCIGIPALLWGMIYSLGSNFPEEMEKIGLDTPMPEPRQGYEIIYPDVISTNNPRYTASFYYLSEKRQVVYRFDADRYLELQGENCEGLIWYHDVKNNIHTRIDKRFFTQDKLPKFNYFNPGKEYIAIPTNDMSSVLFSIDKGKTFFIATVTSYAAVAPEHVERFIGIDDKPITSTFTDVAHAKSFTNSMTVSGNTGYFIIDNGDVLFGDTVTYDRKSPSQRYHSFLGIDPNFKFNINIDMEGVQDFGKYWEIYYKPVYLERIASARNINIEPYQGWDKIRCEIGVEK